MNRGQDLFRADEDLPPEIHLKMALDYLLTRAKQLGMPVTAALIAAAAKEAVNELRRKSARAGKAGLRSKGH